MKRRLSILYLVPLIACTMCSSFPVIINFGGASFVEKPIHSAHETGPLVVANWEDQPKDPKNIWNETWILEEINDTTVFYRDFLSSKGQPVLQFNGTHSGLRGQSFCNHFSAECKFEGGDRLLIGTIDNEWTYCEGEREFYMALSSINHYAIENGRLYLMDDDRELLQFNQYKYRQRVDTIPSQAGRWQ